VIFKGGYYNTNKKHTRGFQQGIIVKLVYFEEFQWINDAIDREKQLKAGSRKKKIDLIIKDNPGWSDLSNGWYD
jgi:predicted GIY-YIG superfamily endonuclease